MIAVAVENVSFLYQRSLLILTLNINKPSDFMNVSGNLLVFWLYHRVLKNIWRKSVSNFI